MAAGSVVRTGNGHKRGFRIIPVSVRTAERLKAKLSLKQDGKAVARTRTTTFGPPTDKIPLQVLQRAEKGPAKLRVKFTDAAGDTVTQTVPVRLPAT